MDPVQQYVLALIIVGLPAVSASAFLVSKAVTNLIRARGLREGPRLDLGRVDAQDHRIAELEGEIGAIREEMERLHAVEGFYKQLGTPSQGGSAALEPGSPRE